MMIKAISQDTTSAAAAAAAAAAAVAVCTTRRVPQHTHIAQTRTLCDMVWKKITKSLGLSQLRCINPDKKLVPHRSEHYCIFSPFSARNQKHTIFLSLSLRIDACASKAFYGY
jgi:hypothetical protein